MFNLFKPSLMPKNVPFESYLRLLIKTRIEQHRPHNNMDTAPAAIETVYRNLKQAAERKAKTGKYPYCRSWGYSESLVNGQRVRTEHKSKSFTERWRKELNEFVKHLKA
jgi:hypothetical protein